MNPILLISLYPDKARELLGAAIAEVFPQKPLPPPEIKYLPDLEGTVTPRPYYNRRKTIKRRKEINRWLAQLPPQYGGSGFVTIYRGMARSEASTVARGIYNASGYYWTRWNMYAAEYARGGKGFVCKAVFPLHSIVGEDANRKSLRELIVAPTKGLPVARSIRFYIPIRRLVNWQKTLLGYGNQFLLIPVPKWIVRRKGKPITNDYEETKIIQ